MGSKGVVNLKGLAEKLKGDKFIGVIFVLGLLGIAIIFLSDLFSPGKSSTVQPAAQSSGVDTAEIEEQLERRLATILQQIDGVGALEVMVTLESTEEYIFAQEGSQSSDSTEQYDEGALSQSSRQSQSDIQYILVEGESGSKQALVKTVIEPKIRGVLVVCDGGGSPYIQQCVLEAVSKLFDISSAKIHVTK